MRIDNQEQARRLNTLIQAFDVGAFEVLAPSSRSGLKYKKKGRATTRVVLEQAFRRTGIISLDPVAGKHAPYKNDYQQFNRADGVRIERNSIMSFKGYKTTVQGFGNRRRISILISFEDFSIDVDPLTLVPDSGTSEVASEELTETGQLFPLPEEPFTVIPPHEADNDCDDTRRENAMLREELQECRRVAEQCEEEKTLYREQIVTQTEQSTEPAEEPTPIHEIPQVEREPHLQEIKETLQNISAAYEDDDKKEARRQEQHLKELVQEATESAASVTVQATENCVVQENKLKNGIHITFTNEPGNDLQRELRKEGFIKHRKGGYYYARRTERRMKFATNLCTERGEAITRTGTGSRAQSGSVKPPKDRTVTEHNLYGGKASRKIKAKLKELFPNVEFSVRYQGYSGGSSIDVWTKNISREDAKRIKEVIRRFGGKTWVSDHTGDSISEYLRGAPFVENGELHQYTVASALDLNIERHQYSDDDKTTTDYKKHFAEYYTQNRPDYTSHVRVEPDETTSTGRVVPPVNDTIYVHRFFGADGSKKMKEKLREIFPGVKFSVTYSASSLSSSIEATVYDVSLVDFLRIQDVVQKFGGIGFDGQHDTDVIYEASEFVENGEHHRYHVISRIYLRKEGGSPTDKTSPDYKQHFSESYPMKQPRFIDAATGKELNPGTNPYPQTEREESSSPTPSPDPQKETIVYIHSMFGTEGSIKIKEKLHEIFPGIHFTVKYDVASTSITVTAHKISSADFQHIYDVLERFGGGRTPAMERMKIDSSAQPSAPFYENGEHHRYDVFSRVYLRVVDSISHNRTRDDYRRYFSEFHPMENILYVNAETGMLLPPENFFFPPRKESRLEPVAPEPVAPEPVVPDPSPEPIPEFIPEPVAPEPETPKEKQPTTAAEMIRETSELIRQLILKNQQGKNAE